MNENYETKALSGNVLGERKYAEASAMAKAQSDSCGAAMERVSAKGIIRQRVRQLNREAADLEALAASLPEQMQPQAESALLSMLRTSRV